jgi:hypothetical protein
MTDTQAFVRVAGRPIGNHQPAPQGPTLPAPTSNSAALESQLRAAVVQMDRIKSDHTAELEAMTQRLAESEEVVTSIREQARAWRGQVDDERAEVAERHRREVEQIKVNIGTLNDRHFDEMTATQAEVDRLASTLRGLDDAANGGKDWARLGVSVGVLAVVVAAAVISFVGTSEFALSSGATDSDNIAKAFPLALEGLAVVALIIRATGRGDVRLARWVSILALGAAVYANAMHSATASMQGRVLAGAIPVAVYGAVELLVMFVAAPRPRRDSLAPPVVVAE